MRRLVVLLALIAAACTAAASDTVPDGTSGDSSSSTAAGAINSTTSTSADTDSSDEGSSSTPSPAPRSSADSSCEVSGEAQPWTTQMVSTAELVLEDNGVEVEAVVYPRPDYRGKPWSQWGQGIVTGDGRFISAIGDHHGVDGNSFLYEYDLDSRNLTMFADLGEVIGHVPGSWGYGKVHAQMVEGPCGIYVSTYWGTRRNTFSTTTTGEITSCLSIPGRRRSQTCRSFSTASGLPRWPRHQQMG